MTNSKIWIAVIVVAIIAVGGYFTPQGKTIVKEVVKESNLGALVGPELYDHITFNQTLTRGGDVTATSSTASTYTLTSSELRRETNYISWTPNVNTTLTTMASTSAPFSDLGTGETREVILYNASTTAASTITFAAGTGVDLQEDEGGSVIVNGLETARITYGKKSDNDVFFIVEPYQLGD